MPNLTITPANIKPTASTEYGQYIARILTPNGIIMAGQLVYYDSDLQGIALADTDMPETAQLAGIALCNAYNFQPLIIATGGEVTFGAILTANVTYVASSTPGLIATIADLQTGDFTAIVGVAKSTSVMKLSLMASQVARV